MPRKVALLIGVSDYGEGIPSLSAPLNDVAEMKRVLENPEMGGFEVETLIDPEPTPMRKEIKKLFTSCGKEDLVLLFFSGHGITDDENKLYLATHITAKDDFDATAVPASFVQQQSKNSYTKRQVIILDCCYSGAFAEGWQAKAVGIDLKKELGAEGRVVLTSSTATQTSFQQENEELSLYTQYLLEGIETGAADKDEDGKIHAHELHEYAKIKVQEVKPKQKPGIITDEEGFNILLTQAPVDDPELNFRKLVENYASKGEISSYRRETLKIKQEEFNLTDQKADEIIDSVLEPFRIHLDNLEKYRENYRQQVKEQYPLDESLAQDLKDWGQQVLGLQDDDLAQIEQDINAEKEAEHQHQQELQQQEQENYKNKLKQYKQEFLEAVEREYPLSNNAREQINIRQQSLGLKDEDIKPIEQKILAVKYQEQEKKKQREQEEYKNKLQQYKQEFSKTINREYPLTKDVCNGLKAFQQYLKLKDEDVKPIEKSIIAHKKAEYQQLLEIEKRQRDKEKQLSTKQIRTAQSSSRKTRIFFGGGIAVLGLALTFSFLAETTPPKLSDNPHQINNSVSSPSNPQITSEELFQRGLDKWKKNDTQGAIADYTQAMKINQNWGAISESYFGLASAYYNRGITRARQGDYRGAIDDYTQAIKLKSDYASAYYHRGNAHSDLKDYQKAIANYTQAIKLKSDDASIYYQRGNAYRHQGYTQAAIADYTQAIKLKSDYASAYYHRGIVHRQQGDNQKAIEDYTQAAELYQKQGNTALSQKALNQITELQH